MIGCESDQSLLGMVQHMMAENRENEKESDYTSNSFNSEVQLYLKESNIHMFIVHNDPVDPEKVMKKRNDPLLYWRDHPDQKPKLATLARRYLSAPPGSVT